MPPKKKQKIDPEEHAAVKAAKQTVAKKIGASKQNAKSSTKKIKKRTELGDGEKIVKKNVKNDSSKSQTEEYTHWLMKSEPESRFENGVDVKFGIEDLKRCPKQTACWDGVRNYQARNFMRDQMKLGEQAFFYHSNCKEPGIAGIIEIARESYVDHTQFDRADPHYDSTSTTEKPRWFMVDVKFVRMLKRFISLEELKNYKSDELKNCALFTRARLSVQPVSNDEWDFILSLEDKG